MIDRLRKQIQDRLDQLTGEADRLRQALAALDPRPTSKASADKPARAASAKPKTSAAKPKPKTSAAKPKAPAVARRTTSVASPSPRRTAPGTTKTAVLAALAGGEALTAGQVAAKTGLARPTVSTTLSTLAKTGEAQKAERGYRIAPAAGE